MADRGWHLAAAMAIALAVGANGCSGSSTTLRPTPAKCQVSLGTASSAVDASGGSVSVAVTTQSECAWNATIDVSWMTIASSASGQGTGSLDVRVSLNPDATVRRGVVTVNGQGLEIDQAAGKCQFTLAPGSQTIAAAGGSGTVVVTAASGCAWNVTDVPGWITIDSGANGTGNGTVNYSVVANPTGGPRTATLTIAGRTFAVTQQAATTTCSYSLDHASQPFGSAGGAGTPIVVTATTGCAWTATSSDAWITGVTPGSGTGTGTVNYSVAANPNGSPRTGTLTIAGQTFTVSQQAATTTCSYSLDHASQSFTALGGAGTPIAVTATAGCSWTATSSDAWIIGVTPATGTGNGTVNYSVAANPTGSPRTGTLTIAGQTFTVSQQAATCSYSLDHASQSFTALGGAGTPIAITATPGCAWTATSSDAWITGVTPGTGTGNGTVSYSVAANPTGSPRTGTLTIAGQTFTVSQQAATCSYSLDHASQSFTALGGAGTPIAITATPGCAWTATSNAIWITGVTPGSGTGNGAVNFIVTANLLGARTATLTIAGQTFTVSQAALLP
jgi:hypothetical protein